MFNKFTVLRLFFSLILLANIFAGQVNAAINPPDFPSCVNPQGTIKASYGDGTHGVVGVVTSYSGTDSVYSVSENVVVQCLCTDQGEGIQTNWWKSPQMSSDEIENFKTQGWIFVPDGSVWGLDPAEYLAKNMNYSCRSNGGSSSSSSNSNNTSSNAVGGVASIGQILALATTGNIKVIYSLALTGLLSLMVGFLLNKRNG